MQRFFCRSRGDNSESSIALLLFVLFFATYGVCSPSASVPIALETEPVISTPEEIKAMTASQRQAFLATAFHEAPRYYPLLFVLAGTGMRLGEGVSPATRGSRLFFQNDSHCPRILRGRYTRFAEIRAWPDGGDVPIPCRYP